MISPAACDSLVDSLTHIAYQFAISLDDAARESDRDELEAIAKRITAKLKDDMRTVIVAHHNGG